MNRLVSPSPVRPSSSRRGRLLPPIALVFLAFWIFSPGAQAAGGSVQGWGYDYYGQVGNGTTNTTGCECVEAPAAVSGISEATQVSGGYYHALALLANGTVMAWGGNESGQLGDGGTTNRPTPVAVKGISNAIAVAAGGGQSAALLANGTVMAWGENTYGELGGGSNSGPETCGATACSKKPILVPGLHGVVAIAGGEDYTLALLADGTVVGWGYNYYGELGDGKGSLTSCECVDTPTPIPGVSKAMAISAGWYLAGVLLADGTVKDWGYNYYGQVGNGTTTTSSPPECYCAGVTPVSGISGARTFVAGGYHGVAQLPSGNLQAWGENSYGELGNGMTETTGCECRTTPTMVSGLLGPQAISAGSYHNVALLPNGTANAWGYNDHGQLGDGTIENRNVPTAVKGLSGASGVFANDYSSYAVIGPSQGLTVSLAGAGSGTVGGPAGILCPSSCSDRYSQSQVEVLRAEAATGSGFAGFSGACVGTGACQVRLDQDQSVTATFGPPKGTAITSTAVSSKKKTASFTFSAPGAITGFECELVRPAPKKKKKKRHGHGKKHHHRALRKSGVPPPSFAACPSPESYKNLTPGGYTFEVRALDSLGADAQPATEKFDIKSPKRKKKHHHRHHRHH